MKPAISPKQRYPCGKLKQPSKAEMEAAIKAREERDRQSVIGVVLAQSHREGDLSQLRATSWGRFCLRNRLSRELFDAGERYASVYRQWAMLSSVHRVEGHVTGKRSGIEPTAETVARLKEEYEKANSIMKGVSMWAIPSLRFMVIDYPTEDPEHFKGKHRRAAINGALALAKHYYDRKVSIHPY